MLFMRFCCASINDSRSPDSASSNCNLILPVVVLSLSGAPPPLSERHPFATPPLELLICRAKAGSASILFSPPVSTTTSMFAARLLGRYTMMSPDPEDSCEAPARRIAPEGLEELVSGLIHAVIVPPAVAACTELATRVRQMLPSFDS